MFVAIAEFDPTFVPKERDLNTLRGMIVGQVEGPFEDGSTGHSDRTEICNGWIWKNIPNTSAALSRLIAVGWVWENEWVEGDFSVGLTRKAEEWCIANLGMPDDIDANHEVIQREIEPLFRRKKEGKSLKTLVKTTSEIVRQTSYTRSEAMDAQVEIGELVRTKVISRRSGAAYKAHVSRRTA